MDLSRGETTLVYLVCIWNNIFLASEYLFVITPPLCLCSAWKSSPRCICICQDVHINNVPLWPLLHAPYLHHIHPAVNTLGTDREQTLRGPPPLYFFFFQLVQTFCHMLAEVPLLFMFLLGRKKVSRLPTKQLLCSLSKKIFSYEMLIEVPRALEGGGGI